MLSRGGNPNDGAQHPDIQVGGSQDRALDGKDGVGQGRRVEAATATEVKGARTTLSFSSDLAVAELICHFPSNGTGPERSRVYSLLPFTPKASAGDSIATSLWNRVTDPKIAEPSRLESLKVLVERLGEPAAPLRMLVQGEETPVRLRPTNPPSLLSFLSQVGEFSVDVLAGANETPVARVRAEISEGLVRALHLQDSKGTVDLSDSPVGRGVTKQVLLDALFALSPSPANTAVNVEAFIGQLRDGVVPGGSIIAPAVGSPASTSQPTSSEAGDAGTRSSAFRATASADVGASSSQSRAARADGRADGTPQQEIASAEAKLWNSTSRVESVDQISCRVHSADGRTTLSFVGAYGMHLVSIDFPDAVKAQAVTSMHQMMGALQNAPSITEDRIVELCRAIFEVPGAKVTYPKSKLEGDLFLDLYERLHWDIRPQLYPGFVRSYAGLEGVVVPHEEYLVNVLLGRESLFFIARGRPCDEVIVAQIDIDTDWNGIVTVASGIGDRWQLPIFEGKVAPDAPSTGASTLSPADRGANLLVGLMTALSDGQTIPQISRTVFQPVELCPVRERSEGALPALGKVASMWFALKGRREVAALDVPPILDKREIRELPRGRAAYLVAPREVTSTYPDSAILAFIFGPTGLLQVEYSTGERGWNGAMKWRAVWNLEADGGRNPLTRAEHLSILVSEVSKQQNVEDGWRNRADLDPDSLGLVGRFSRAIRDRTRARDKTLAA